LKWLVLRIHLVNLNRIPWLILLSLQLIFHRNLLLLQIIEQILSILISPMIVSCARLVLPENSHNRVNPLLICRRIVVLLTYSICILGVVGFLWATAFADVPISFYLSIFDLLKLCKLLRNSSFFDFVENGRRPPVDSVNAKQRLFASVVDTIHAHDVDGLKVTQVPFWDHLRVI